MKQSLLCLVVIMTMCSIAYGNHAADSTAIKGRWDLTLNINGTERPSWLEVKLSGHRTWVGHFVGVVGSARPVSKIEVTGNTFRFGIPPQWEEGSQDHVVEGTFEGDRMQGTVTFPSGKRYAFTGVRAPAMRDARQVNWDKPITLIANNSLKGWHATGENQWVVEQGILRSPKSGANIETDEKFSDFKLHVEFRYPKGSNSGVYLRGRYEVQIADSKGMDPLPIEFGAVYGFITPAEQAAGNPGEWQTYDITLIGRMITLVANGKPVITNQEIPGITGGAIDSKEGEPGPILLQGDHGPIEFRNIVITPVKK